MAMLLVAQTGRAQVAFDNTHDASTANAATLTDGATTYFSDPAEFGDEIGLSPAQGAVLTNFSIQFFATNLPVEGATMELRLYANDGTNYGSDFQVPGTLIYDSGLFALNGGPESPFVDNTVHTLTFDQASMGLNVYVPANFTWTVQFAGLAGAAVGLVQYDPTSEPLTGTDYAAFWEASGGEWLYRTSTNGVDINFGAVATVVAIVSVPLMNPQKYVDGGFGFDFTNQPDLNFSVITTTNLTDPLYKWVNLGPPSQDAPGHYIFYDAKATDRALGFYQVLRN